MMLKNLNKYSLLLLLLTAFLVGKAQISNVDLAAGAVSTVRSFNNVTLETSLKPFKKNDKAYIKKIAEEIFTQWSPLLKNADTVSIMLWTSDGSEILDYTGRLGQPLEWAKYIGNPNTKHSVGTGPSSLSLHERAYLYMESPPEFTYKDLKYIIQTLRETGRNITGKPIRIGATFDPGPEFAKSEFKYKKHPEISQGGAMGEKSFVFSYAVLNEDQQHYAGYPKGIPANTPFGTFFGRQSQHFLKDLGYDYLWLSNGFGFGMEPWSSTGVIFTGTSFNTEKLAETKTKIIDFWSLFRKECKDFRIETRGTNLSTGIDLAKDGVDLNAIYKGGFNLLPPPNSPWAALDGDFGLEMIGYMSRIAQLPDNRYLFRYYTHDPWWLNSPWLDRYGREPHDIYLPMSVSRINQQGEVTLPTHLNFLTIDNSFGDMPAQVPNEVIPHILNARTNSPTAPGPLVWVYPFEEYHRWAKEELSRVPEMYYGDWFIRQAINNGFPLNTVISSSYMSSALSAKPDLFSQSILVSIVPDAGSVYESKLINFVENGGKVIIYGPADHASTSFNKLLNLKQVAPLEGELTITDNYLTDIVKSEFPSKINHQALFSGGGLGSNLALVNDTATHILVKMEQGGSSRDAVWIRTLKEWKGGRIAYVRGTNSSHFEGGRLLKPDDANTYFTGPSYMRYVLKEFGLEYGIEKNETVIKNPVLSISRSNNAFFFAGYVPNTSVKHRLKMQQGAPIMNGYDVMLSKGVAHYSFPTAWNREARVFVTQQDGVVSCKEMHSGELGISRRLQISGLKNATVRIYPDLQVTGAQLNVYLNAEYPWKKGKITVQKGEEAFGHNFKVVNVTGDLVVSW